jgi:hypothetical protein
VLTTKKHTDVFLQGDYSSMFPGLVDGSFSTFYVVGALISMHDGVNCVDGQPYKCMNERHSQLGPGGYCQFSKVNAFEMERGNFDFMISNHVNTCIPGNFGARSSSFKCAGDTKPKIIPGVYKDIEKVPIFIIVLKQWVDMQRQCVVVPKTMTRVNLNPRVVHNIDIWNLSPHDWTFFLNYRLGNLTSILDWTEYSFNSITGPFLTMIDACHLRDVMNHMFVEKKRIHDLSLKVPPVVSSPAPSQDTRQKPM